MIWNLARAAICSLLVVTTAACDSPPATTEIRVMTFNIEWGGENISFDNVVKAIQRSEADIAGIQEAEGNLEKLALALGWYFDRRSAVVSRFPLYDPPGADGLYVLAEIEPGLAIAIANLHLPSDPYGPDLVRDGHGIDEVLANERAVRLPFLKPYVDGLPGLHASQMPVFVTGDFNSPAHTDWTAHMVGTRRFLDTAIAWPVSVMMQEAGFKDSWRSVYPDALAHPGLTWWAGRPPLADYAPGEGDPQDRIDLIWYSGPARPVAAIIAGEPGAPEVTVPVSPWPSDHRAVTVTFEVTPHALPDLLNSSHRIYRPGETISVRVRMAGSVACQVNVTDDMQRSITKATGFESCDGQFAFAAPSAGHYNIVADAGDSEMQYNFDVLDHDARPALRVSMDDTPEGARVTAHWQNAPGNRNDYLAVYADDSGDPQDILAWAYIESRPHGHLDISELVRSSGPGPRRVRLMKDDGYEMLAETPAFRVEQSPAH